MAQNNFIYINDVNKLQSSIILQKKDNLSLSHNT